MNRHIALVEDDPVILENYADLLAGAGFTVDTYGTKQAALNGLRCRPPELVLLDITMNGERDAGFDICAAIRRATPDIPVIFLTSHDREVDKISGMRIGADDYITKDVSLDYLIVRVEALFRRRDAYLAAISGTATAGPPALGTSTGIKFDQTSSAVTWWGEKVDLSLTHFWMLYELCRDPGQAKSHLELMRAAKIVVEPNTVIAHVKAIRDAFRRIDAGFDCIRTERGRGYRWLPDERHAHSGSRAGKVTTT